MKRITKIMLSFVAVLAFSLTACQKDDDNNGNGNNGGGNGGGNGDGDGGTPVMIHNAVQDVDGNSYDAVEIGDQVWMAQNLKTRHYADGTAISKGGSVGTVSADDPYFYVNTELDTTVYGFHYNWPAVMHGASPSTSNPSGVQGICPSGWHLPSDAEWKQLTDYVSSRPEFVCGDSATYIAKALASKDGWYSNYMCPLYSIGCDLSANNRTGFGALPASSYVYPSNPIGVLAFFWSSSEANDGGEAWGRSMVNTSTYVSRLSYDKRSGFSVRCVRN